MLRSALYIDYICVQHEVEVCRKEQPFVIRPVRSESEARLNIESNPLSPLPMDSTEAQPGTSVDLPL